MLLMYNQGCRVGEALVIHYPAYFACESLINNAYSHPEWTAGEGRDILDGILLEGGGHASLRVVGMSGTYYFCAAVMCSILLSLIFDVYDARDCTRVEGELLWMGWTHPTMVGNGKRVGARGGRIDCRIAVEVVGRRDAPAVLLAPGLHVGHVIPSRRSVCQALGRCRRQSFGTSPIVRHALPHHKCHLLRRAVLLLLSVLSPPLVLYAVTLPTMQRLVFGGGPTLLHEVLGMVWEREYSLASLVRTTGDAGGWDTFLMLTFGLFAIVGPVIRSICLLLHVLIGLPEALLGECIERPRRRTTLRLALYQATSTLRRALLPVIDALGAFCCWEVLVVALFMIQLEIPSITDTIYQDDRCREADPEHGRTCIEDDRDGDDDGNGDGDDDLHPLLVDDGESELEYQVALLLCVGR